MISAPLRLGGSINILSRGVIVGWSERRDAAIAQHRQLGLGGEIVRRVDDAAMRGSGARLRSDRRPARGRARGEVNLGDRVVPHRPARMALEQLRIVARDDAVDFVVQQLPEPAVGLD